MMRLLLGLVLVGAMFSAALADTVIVNEGFESYADDAAFQAVWVPTVGNGSAPANPADVSSGILTTDNTLFPGIQGQAIDHIGATASTPGMVNQYTPVSGGPAPGNAVSPSASQSLFLSADIFESGIGNERMTVGLRNRTSTENLIELGIYNQVTCDATVVGCTPSVSPVPPETPGFRNFVGYSFRSRLFASFGGDLVAEPNWQVFILPQELDRTTDLDDFVTIGDVGAGWHRFTAEITPTTVTYELDLFRDGLRNTSTTPDLITGIRPGTAGVDASITFELAVTANGFDSLRIGGPSGASSAGSGAMAFDNILLSLVDVVANTPDFNNSGTVDAADYTIWRDNLGLMGTATQMTGDANGDTNVDGTDYDLWKAAFGTMPGSGSGLGSGAAVPEPAALVMSLMGAAMLALTRRRR